jgi:hypothetical protein
MNMKSKTRIVIATSASILVLVVSWALWTSHSYVRMLPSSFFGHPIFAVVNEQHTGYYFFVLRGIVLLITGAAFALATWCIVRVLRTPRRTPVLCSAFALILSGQLLGFTLLAFFPEFHLVTLVDYGNDSRPNYVKGFSKRKFFQIRKDMKRSEVEQMIGQGRRGTTIPGFEDHSWHYSGGFSETGWRFWVTFTTNGIVESRRAYFWWD